MAEGWRAAAPHDELSVAPVSGGGAGFLDVLSATFGDAVPVAATVVDPLGRDVPAVVLLVEERDRRTVYVESAQAAGLHLLAACERNPSTTSSYGVGQLIRVALEQQPTRIVVAVGDAATNDGGAGMLAALGAGSDAHLARGGLALADLPDGALSGLPALRESLLGVELVSATQEDLPLLGFQGTSAAMSAQRGAGPEQAQQLEYALGRFREVADRALEPPRDLFTGLPRRLDREPGSGAGGGIGYGLALLGARRESATAICFEAWDWDELLRGSDLVVTGEGCLDWRTLGDSVIASISRAGAVRGLPVVAIAGTVEVSRRDVMGLGLAGSYAVAEQPARVAAAMADPVTALRERTARVAATWSPGPPG